MIPTNSTIVKYICEDCKTPCEYTVVTRLTKSRKLCPECAKKRKYDCIKLSNESYITHGKRGRPALPKNKIYGKDDMKMAWDDGMELGV